MKILVNNLNVVGIASELTGSYSSLDESGLIIYTGQLVLGYNPSFPVTLDNRLTRHWDRGTLVRVLDDSDRPLPVLGHSYIESAQYDGYSLLTLQLVCILGLVNSRTPADLGICVAPLESISASSAIRLLLIRAGVSESQISLNNASFQSSIKRIEPVADGDSFVRLAGSLAFANGNYLIQNTNGQVVNVDFTRRQTTSRFTLSRRQCITYDRLYDIQQPPDIYAINSGDLVIYPGGNNTKSTSRLGAGVDFRMSTTDSTTNHNSRTTSSTQTEVATLGSLLPSRYPNSAGMLVHSRLNVEEKYEQRRPGGFSALAKSWRQCVPTDQGRLLSKTTRKFDSLAVALSAFNEIAKKEENGREVDSLSLALTQITTEEWTYNTTEPGDLPRAGESVKQVIRTSQMYGKVVPIIGSNTLTRPDEEEDNQIITFPYSLIPTRLEVVTWLRNQDRRTWTQTRTVAQINYEVNPEAVQELIAKEDTPLINVLDYATSLYPVENTVVVNSGEPNFNRFPQSQSEQVFPFQSKAVLGPGRRQKTISINANGSPPKSRVDRLAAWLGKWEWGKSQGQIVSIASTPTSWADKQQVLPTDRCVISESPTTAAYYLIDSLAVAWRPNEFVVSFNAAWEATANNLAVGSVPLVPPPQAFTPAQIQPNFEYSQQDVVVSVSAVSPLNVDAGTHNIPSDQLVSATAEARLSADIEYTQRDEIVSVSAEETGSGGGGGDINLSFKASSPFSSVAHVVYRDASTSALTAVSDEHDFNKTSTVTDINDDYSDPTYVYQPPATT